MGTKEELQKFFIGTSGWSYKHWAGLFYPSHIKPDKYLEYYMTRFSCVELNSCFYHLPKSATVKGWVSRTPDFFRFCPKLSRFITHRKRLVDIDEALQRFFNLFDAMKHKLGPVLIQLPPGLKFDKLLIHDFLTRLHKLYSDYRFAVEVRNSSWLNDDFFDLLSINRIAFVMADSGNRFPYCETITTDSVYLRFHGPEKLYASEYSEDELFEYAKKIVDWLKSDKEVWIFFNNDFHGYAVKNAEQLETIIATLYLN